MEMIQLEMDGKDQNEFNESYEKPMIKTFGSVAKLTLANRTGSVSDFFFGKQKSHHHGGHGR